MKDHVLARFTIRPDILWSDGEQLTAEDSKNSYEIAASMFPQAKAEIIARVLNNYAQDPSTIIWETTAGYLPSDYISSFFTRLPEQDWGVRPLEELTLSDTANRAPPGWGADGKCEYISESALLDLDIVELLSLNENGEMHIETMVGTACEFIEFGISSNDESLPPIFSKKETRQAIANCIDRERLVNELSSGFFEGPHSRFNRTGNDAACKFTPRSSSYIQ